MLRVEICQMTDFSKRSREYPLFQEPLSFSDEGMKVTMKWEFSSVADCLLALLRLKELRKLLRIVGFLPCLCRGLYPNNSQIGGFFCSIALEYSYFAGRSCF